MVSDADAAGLLSLPELRHRAAVAMPDGWRAIETVLVGDTVIAKAAKRSSTTFSRRCRKWGRGRG
jgi:hypothetical protein